MRAPRADGFSLVELAIVLLIMGLLIGAVLKGQQLHDSARVHGLAESVASVQTAYLGFVDRYQKVPGDWNATAASHAIGGAVAGGGNSNGLLDTTAADPWTELNAMWEHLSKSGLIDGQYAGTPATEPDAGNNLAPLNVFNSPMLVGYSSDFEGAWAKQLHVTIGRRVPVAVIRELDVKLDDSLPHRGSVRATLDDVAISVFTGANDWGGRDANCVADLGAGTQWAAPSGTDDCNAVVLF